MYHEISMKTILLVVVSFFLLMASPLRAEESRPAASPLGTFSYDFVRLGADEASQISALKSIGYAGMAMNLKTEKHLASLKRYQAAIGDDPFRIYAGYYTVVFDEDLAVQNAHLDNVIDGLKKSDGALWIILRDRKSVATREQVVAFLRSLAARTKAAGVALIIYPHYNDYVATAEEAIPFLKAVDNGNVFISMHLCHEVRAGNGDRLDEVAAKIKPWLRLPTINGADIDVVNELDELEGWKRAIQPLTKGDYDSSKFVDALKSVGYAGPVILKTYGLKTAAADHHHTSFKKFQEMTDK